MKKFDVPRAVVGSFTLNPKCELLLVKSWKWEDLWSVPGGKVELGETIADATVRETLEEAGIKVKVDKVINMQEVIFPKSFSFKSHFIFIDVLCRSANSKVKLDNRELQEYVWIRPKAALKLKLNTYTRRAILQLTDKKAMRKWFYADAE